MNTDPVDVLFVRYGFHWTVTNFELLQQLEFVLPRVGTGPIRTGASDDEACTALWRLHAHGVAGGRRHPCGPRCVGRE